MAGPLAGLLAVELGAGIPSGFCGRLLAGFGATVVKVEPPDGDPARRARVVLGGPAPDPEAAPLFVYLGMGKRSTIGSRDDDAIRRLVERADVLIDDRLWPVANPSLVQTVLTPFGTTGPRASWLGENITVFGAGGQLALTGEPDREPLCTAGEQGWYQLGLAGFAATCVALHERERSGLGQLVDVAANEVMAGALEGFGPTNHALGAPTMRSGTHRYSLMGIYPCADGHAAIFAAMRQAPTVAELLGDPDLPERLRTATVAELVQHAEALRGAVGEFFAKRTREDVRAVARETGLPLAPVASIPEVASSAHLRERGFLADIGAGGRSFTVPGPPCRLPASPWTTAPPPGLGELSRNDLAELTGSRPTASRANEGTLPLDGIRVVDMTQYWLGPYCTKWLADFGADVIKIESPPRIDFVRTIVATRDVERWYDRSPYFNVYARGKRSLSIDPLTQDGRRVLLELVAVSDVVVENFAPGYMSRAGLDYESLRSVKPDLVMLSGSAYGQAGRDSSLAGVGTTMEALSGIASLNGYADAPEQPYNTGVAYGDPTGGTMAAAAVLLALRHRAGSGEGQHIDLAAHEVLASLIGEQLAALGAGLEPSPKGNSHPDMAPHGCYPCEGEDAWVTVALRDEGAWPRLAALIERADLSPLDIEGRRENAYEIDASLTAWAVVRTDEDAAEQLQAIGVAAAPVRSTAALLLDPQLVARAYYVPVDDPDQGTWPHDGIAWRLSRTPGRIAGPAPRFAQHTREVLRDVLGYDEAAINAVYASGAAADTPTR